MAKIFISYRRKSWPFTHRLAEEIQKVLDAEFFVDLTGIDEDDFERSLLRNLRQSNAVLLIVTEETFSERIKDPQDWVRREIRESLNHNIPLVIVAVDGLFPPSDLPDDIKGVVGKQGIRFFAEFFVEAVQSLANFLVRIGVASRKEPPHLSEPDADWVTVAGQWTDPSDGDTVFFVQQGKKVLGIYDFGQRHKVGIYRGYLKGGVLSYDWKWLDRDLSGGGRMTLAKDGKKLSGEWWYDEDKKLAEAVSYVWVSHELPEWLTDYDLKMYWD